MPTRRPGSDEYDPYFHRYIERVPAGDIRETLARQLEDATSRFAEIDEEASLYRYAPDRWSGRELLAHVTDTERIFSCRALWFARGLPSPLPGFDQDIAAPAAQADHVSWAGHVEEFRAVRTATLLLFRHLPDDAWERRGEASGARISVRALASLCAGHLAHHLAILDERYRPAGATGASDFS